MSALEFIALVAVGAAVGTYASAIGAGGGFLLAPLLLIRHPDAEPAAVAAASLAVATVSSGLNTIAAERARQIDRPLVGLLVVSAAPAALLGAVVTALLPRTWFAVLFALLLLSVGVYLVWRPTAGMLAPRAGGWARALRDREGNAFVYRVPVRRSVVVAGAAAFVSALAGIGGGLLYTPLATRVMRVPHALAVPASHAVITAIAASVVTFHLAAGNAGEPMRDVPALAIGVVAAVPLGRRAHRRLGEGPLMRALAAGLLLVSLRTLFIAIEG